MSVQVKNGYESTNKYKRGDIPKGDRRVMVLEGGMRRSDQKRELPSPFDFSLLLLQTLALLSFKLLQRLP